MELSDALRAAAGADVDDPADELLREAQVEALRDAVVEERTSLYLLEGLVPSPATSSGRPPIRSGRVSTSGCSVLGGLALGLVMAGGLTWLVVAVGRPVRTVAQVRALGLPATTVGPGRPPVLPHEAVVRQRLHAGATLRVVALHEGHDTDSLVGVLSARFGPRETAVGRVVRSRSPLQIGWTDGFAAEDLFVVAVRRGEPLPYLEALLESLAHEGSDVLTVLVLPRRHRTGTDHRAAPHEQVQAEEPVDPAAAEPRGVERGLLLLRTHHLADEATGGAEGSTPQGVPGTGDPPPGAGPLGIAQGGGKRR